MSMHVVKFYAEIEIEVWAEYTPEEKPDYSDLSPCDGSPAEAEPTNIVFPQLPTITTSAVDFKLLIFYRLFLKGII